MSAKLVLAAAAMIALQQVVIPLGKPQAVERPIAPLNEAGPEFAATCKDWDDWDKPAPPVRIHGNTYLVGTCGISAILITASDGHILIDSGTEKGADLVARNIHRLGFRLADVRFLLHSHEHLDHVGGIARLQQLTGAQFIASPSAAKVFDMGLPTADDPQAGMHPPLNPARVDRIIRDGEEVRLGSLVLTAVATPGHAPGALSWHWGSCDGGVCRRLVYSDSLSPISRDGYRFSDHPGYLAAYRSGLARLAALDCEILLTPHPSASDMINRLAGRSALVGERACSDYSAAMSARLDERLAKEAAGR